MLKPTNIKAAIPVIYLKEGGEKIYAQKIEYQ